MIIESFADANMAAMTVWAADRLSLDEELRTKFDKVISSPIQPEVAAHFPEFVFAHADKFSKASKELAADVAEWATGNGFYGLREDKRGELITKSLRGTKLTKEEKPVALQQFKDTPVEAGPPPGPTPPAA